MKASLITIFLSGCAIAAFSGPTVIAESDINMQTNQLRGLSKEKTGDTIGAGVCRRMEVVDPQTRKLGYYDSCIGANSTVTTRDGRLQRVGDLKLGDEVQVYDSVKQELSWAPIFYVRERGHANPVTILDIQLKGVNDEKARSVSLTHSHLIYAADGSLVAARKLEVGQKVLLASGEAVVTSVGTKEDMTLSPITTTGNIVVDGDIIVSCFTEEDDVRKMEEMLPHFSGLLSGGCDASTVAKIAKEMDTACISLFSTASPQPMINGKRVNITALTVQE